MASQQEHRASGSSGGPQAGPESGNPKADTEAMAINTATTIAGLRSRLGRPDILRHPKVRRELQALLELVAMLLGPAEPGSGRHRVNTGQADAHTSDALTHDLKPNPLAATNAAEFIDALWAYRAWSGEPSWRTMANRAHQVVVHSTIYAAMNGSTLPKLEVVRAIIIGCNGSQEDLQAFIAAWHRISPGKPRHPANVRS
jgi:hypothetical protein